MDRYDYLYHHGILGQKWGKRNGPPYPLNESDKSSKEKRLEKSKKESYNENEKKGLSVGQKRAIKIGVAAVATTLAAIGTYKLIKSGKLNKAIDFGKAKVDSLLKRDGKTDVREFLNHDIAGANPNVGKSYKQINRSMVSLINGGMTGFASNTDNRRNCTHCTLSYILNSVFGEHTIAKGCSGIDEKSGMVMGGRDVNIFKAIFDGIKVSDYKSNPVTLDEAIRKLPNGSTGILHIGIPSSSVGHVINWEKTLDGKTSIVDSQIGGVFKNAKEYIDNIWGQSVSTYQALDFTSATIKSEAKEILDKMVM